MWTVLALAWVCGVAAITPAPPATDTAGLVRYYGYALEEHEVVTEDGYILKMFRIPPKGGRAKDRVVFLQHCALCSSEVFLVLGPSHSLGFLLAKEGYDVWLGELRGTRASSRHVNLTTSDNLYWSFSWHEVGVYDLSAELDYILERTGVERLYYVGHSMGNTIMYALLCTRPQYNHKIRLFVAMAPSVLIHNMRSRLARSALTFLEWLAGRTGPDLQLVPGLYETRSLRRILCGLLPAPCFKFYSLLVGEDPPQQNLTLASVLFSILPSPVSLKSYIHYKQLVDSGKFQMYDLGGGPGGNMKAYNSSSPPAYRLDLVTAPTALYYGHNDLLVHPRDVKELMTRQKSVVHEYLVPHSLFSHTDFLFAKDVKKLVNDDLIKLFTRF